MPIVDGIPIRSRVIRMTRFRCGDRRSVRVCPPLRRVWLAHRTCRREDGHRGYERFCNEEFACPFRRQCPRALPARGWVKSSARGDPHQIHPQGDGLRTKRWVHVGSTSHRRRSDRTGGGDRSRSHTHEHVLGGDGRGRCIADFTSWCWFGWEADDDCTAASNDQRTRCKTTSSNGQSAPFKVCVAGAAEATIVG